MRSVWKNPIMKLEKITYSHEEAGDRSWTISDFVLKDINLLVGKNASGKSMTLNIVGGLARSLKTKQVFYSGKWDLQFDNKGSKIRYELEMKKQKVVMENFYVDSKCLIDRGIGGFGEIYSVTEKKFMKFQPPDDELAVVARRDSIQHPYLEPLNEWARNLRLYHFGDRLGQDRPILLNKDFDLSLDPSDEHATGQIFHEGDRLFHLEFKKNVIENMRDVGYALDDILIESLSAIRTQNDPRDSYVLCVKESGLKGFTDQIIMSSGMFRALSIVIHLNYSLLSGKPSCLIIDDIGEGLDFERSCNLIEVVMNKAKASSVQLIMSTNDRFVMNKVPLEYWSVIRRKAHTSEIINKENSPEIFEDFKFTGLNNFDFFARYLED